MSPELKSKLKIILTHDGQGAVKKYEVLIGLLYAVRDASYGDSFSEDEITEIERMTTQDIHNLHTK